MSKPSPTRYRTTNWSSYTASLRKRGSLLIWLDREITWLAPHDGSPGRPAVFSDAAVQFCLTIKVLFKLPLRQTAGMVAIDRQATAIIPIRKNGRPWKEDCPAAIARNKTLRATRHYGRAFWKRWTGYHVRSRIEANPLMVCRQTIAGQRMRCLKAFGERIAARHPDSQTAEIQIRVAHMNRFSALGTAEIVRVA
ncbi:MAG: transposase [Gemmobacter sp.]|nr:transposase [Gemmobacter sp.]